MSEQIKYRLTDLGWPKTPCPHTPNNNVASYYCLFMCCFCKHYDTDTKTVTCAHKEFNHE